MSEVIRPGEVTAEQRLKWARELQRSEAYQGLILPELQRAFEEHTSGCCDRNLTPEKRAEHIEARHLAERLLKFVDDIEAKTRATLRRG